MYCKVIVKVQDIISLSKLQPMRLHTDKRDHFALARCKIHPLALFSPDSVNT